MKVLTSAHDKISSGGQFDENVAGITNCSAAFKAAVTRDERRGL